MPELANWMMAFLRVSALLVIFPVFSATNIPVRMRVALGALTAFLVAPNLPPIFLDQLNLAELFYLMILEVLVGLVMGFASRILFYAVELAGTLISTEVGLSMPPGMNPFGQSESGAPGLILTYFTAMIFLSLDLHHWLLASFERSYALVPVGAAHFTEPLALEMIRRTGQIFLIGIQLTAPIMAVSLVITLLFAVMARAIPTMNVFTESMGIKVLAGLAVMGLTFQLMAQHITRYLGNMAEDVLRVAKMMGGA